MVAKIAEKLRRRLIKNFMDVIILMQLRKSPMSGYDVISYVHKRFGILMSSGTVYSLLYSLERNGLIKGSWNQRKRIYKLTKKGGKNIEAVIKANGEIQNSLRNLLMPS